MIDLDIANRQKKMVCRSKRPITLTKREKKSFSMNKNIIKLEILYQKCLHTKWVCIEQFDVEQKWSNGRVCAREIKTILKRKENWKASEHIA